MGERTIIPMTRGDEERVPVSERAPEPLDVIQAWHRDVALELWIDVVDDRATLTLDGLLDESTSESLVRTVRQLATEGIVEISLVTRAVRIRGRAGFRGLVAATVAARAAGCTLVAARPSGVDLPVLRVTST